MEPLPICAPIGRELLEGRAASPAEQVRGRRSASGHCRGGGALGFRRWLEALLVARSNDFGSMSQTFFAVIFWKHGWGAEALPRPVYL